MEIYKCKHCDEIYEKIYEGAACHEEGCACNDMDLVAPQTADWKNEKHVPIFSKSETGTKVTVGSTLHPMVDDHWITMIELADGDYMMRKFLHPGDAPVVEFPMPYKESLKAREYCNKHGLWSS
jgi:superoxide reductase